MKERVKYARKSLEAIYEGVTMASAIKVSKRTSKATLTVDYSTLGLMNMPRATVTEGIISPHFDKIQLMRSNAATMKQVFEVS